MLSRKKKINKIKMKYLLLIFLIQILQTKITISNKKPKKHLIQKRPNLVSLGRFSEAIYKGTWKSSKKS